MMKYTTNHYTKSYHINRFGNLSTSFLFYNIQEIAGEHAIKLGFGYEELVENQLFWVLSRIKVKIIKRPRWREKFNVTTIARGTDGFMGYRDFYFTDDNGKTIVEGTSSWLAINLQTKRIQRLTNLKNFPDYEEGVFGINAPKVNSPKSDSVLNFSPVLFNEIDINQHFNSGRYIERILDSFDFSFHEKHELVEFEINFAKEGMPGDNLGIKKEQKDNSTFLCSVVREKDGAELIKAKLVWKVREVIKG